MALIQKNLTPTQTEWTERIAAWETSGLSQAVFCQQQGLVYGTFIYWRSHLKKLTADSALSGSVSFLSVSVNRAEKPALVLRINDRYSIELQTGFDADLLRQVVQTIHCVA